MADVLVTGASGFIGSAVARELNRLDFAVRALIRPSSSRTNLANLKAEICLGDLCDAVSVRRAMQGVRFVFHVAADYRLWVPTPDAMMASNVIGTRTVMEEALRAGVERVIYTSSVSTLAVRRDREPADETGLQSEETAIGVYKRSKIRAERLVETMIRTRGLPAIIVNPSTPVGPGDVRPTPTGRIIVQAARGRIPGYVDTGLNLVHVDDVAKGHLAALHRGRIGERYILGGQNVLFSDMLADIAMLTGRRAPRLRVPRSTLIPIAYVAEALARIHGKEPFATLDGVRMSRYRMFFSTEKAERELGIQPRPYREALEGAIRWFRDAGYLN